MRSKPMDQLIFEKPTTNPDSRALRNQTNKGLSDRPSGEDEIIAEMLKNR